jgi:hypothetical protein
VLEKKARGRECLDALRQLYQVLLVYPRKYPSPHFRQLATTMYAFPLGEYLARARGHTHAGCSLARTTPAVPRSQKPSCRTDYGLCAPASSSSALTTSPRFSKGCGSLSTHTHTHTHHTHTHHTHHTHTHHTHTHTHHTHTHTHNHRVSGRTLTAWYSVSNRQLLEFILPATLALGGDSALTRHLPFFVQCVTTQDPVFRTSAFPGLILSRACTTSQSAG